MATYKSQQYDQMNYTLFICVHTHNRQEQTHTHTLNSAQGPDSPEMSRLARAKTTNPHMCKIYTLALLKKPTSKTF